MEILMLFVFIICIILVVAWIVLPFAVFGVERRLEKLIDVQNQMLAFMQESRVGQLKSLSGSEPNEEGQINEEPSAIPYNLRGKVREMIRDGSYSVAGIALATNLKETDIEKEVLRLHKSGVLLKEEAERILGQQMT